jgi:hypothetical protein
MSIEWRRADSIDSSDDDEDTVRARAFDLDVELRQQYSNGLLRPNAPSWAYMVYHVEQTITRARASWNGPLFHLMPYCLHPMVALGLQSCCIVNRNYKPIGYTRCSYAHYELARAQHITAGEFEALRDAGVVTDRGYIHNDGSTPRESAQMLRAYRRALTAMSGCITTATTTNTNGPSPDCSKT